MSLSHFRRHSRPEVVVQSRPARQIERQASAPSALRSSLGLLTREGQPTVAAANIATAKPRLVDRCRGARMDTGLLLSERFAAALEA
ncbi:MAG: hypothetical protein ACHREM_34015 [Polyangiales bacterium]